jgi:hypothetical protein
MFFNVPTFTKLPVTQEIFVDTSHFFYRNVSKTDGLGLCERRYVSPRHAGHQNYKPASILPPQDIQKYHPICSDNFVCNVVSLRMGGSLAS